MEIILLLVILAIVLVSFLVGLLVVVGFISAGVAFEDAAKEADWTEEDWARWRSLSEEERTRMFREAFREARIRARMKRGK